MILTVAFGDKFDQIDEADYMFIEILGLRPSNRLPVSYYTVYKWTRKKMFGLMHI
jgi:hypothetical protein